MMQYIRKVVARKNDEGATAVEYGLLVAAIAAVIVLVVFALGGFVHGAFSKTCSAISAGGTTSAGVTNGATCAS